MQTLYLDNQASTPIDEVVLEEMLSAGFGNPHSNQHAVGWRASALVERAREDVAELIGAQADEIFFTSGATEANNLAILGVRRAKEHGRGTIVTSSIEHKSVLASCEALALEHGFERSVVQPDSHGLISEAALARAAAPNQTALISIGMVNNEIGVIQDLSALRQAAGAALLHCDAAQAPEAMAMSKTADLCDLMSLSAHKMRGPMGIGALYIARQAQRHIAPILYGGDQQGGIRPGTLPVHLCVGMGAACRSAAKNANDRLRIGSLRDEFLLRLRELGLAFELNGPRDFSRRHPGNANLLLPGVDAEQLIALLQPKLAISTGSACTSGTMEPSHVLTALGLNHDEASSSLRVSLGYHNTADEIAEAAQMLFNAYLRTV